MRWYTHNMKKEFSPEYKVKVALEAVKGIKSPGEIAGAYGVHPTQIGFWKRQLLERAPAVFTDAGTKHGAAQQRLIDELYRVIGQRDTELEWLKKNMRAFDT